MSLFPDDSASRKTFPMYSGLLQYFPSALAVIAQHSLKSNEKHNPGQPLHHDRAKSDDEPDALVRHLMEGDYVGMAWRALSLLQKHCEANGAPVAPAARNARPAPSQYGELIPHERAKAMLRDGVVFERVEDCGVITGDLPPPPFPDDDEGLTPAEAPREHAA